MHKPDYQNGFCQLCGEHFTTRAKLARHVQKWNAKLRGVILTR